MFNRSTREVLSSCDPLLSQSENHVLLLLNMCPNMKYRRMLAYYRKEMALTGTCVIDEVWLAMQKGYS